MESWSKIKCIVLDVDGTLTDGGIFYDSSGQESKRFDVKDGLGIKVAMEAGFQIVILTGRKSSMVERRAKELGIKFLLDGIQDKYSILSAFAENHSISMNQICYIGDDWNDMRAMTAVGLCACPADAAPEIQQICQIISKKNGGHGAVRECLEILLRKTGLWETAVRRIY